MERSLGDQSMQLRVLKKMKNLMRQILNVLDHQKVLTQIIMKNF